MSDICRIINSPALTALRVLPDASVQCCITSPPYWGLRDYGLPAVKFSDGWEGQLGHESAPEMFVAHLVEIFHEVRRVLKDDGTLWLNLGDSYSGSGRGKGDVKTDNKGNTASRGIENSRGSNRTRLANGRGDQPAILLTKDCAIPDMRGSPLPAGLHESARMAGQVGRAWVPPPPGLKNKDLIGIPWMVAFALRADGWYFRSGIPWLKRNCMPESVTDRPTTATEYIFLLSKTDDYYYDNEAVAMPLAGSSESRLAQDVERQTGSARANGGEKTNGNMKAVAGGKHSVSDPRAGGKRIIDNVKTARAGGADHDNPFGKTRNLRNTDFFIQSWQGLLNNEDGDPLAFIVNPKGYKDAHFATWPPKLVQPMVLAGCPLDGVILDPFAGSGTTGKVALELGRRAILVELNPDYCKLIKERTTTTGGFL